MAKTKEPAGIDSARAAKLEVRAKRKALMDDLSAQITDLRSQLDSANIERVEKIKHARKLQQDVDVLESRLDAVRKSEGKVASTPLSL